MAKVYSEKDLKIPALIRIMKAGENGISTTELIKHLTSILQPSGHDVEIISGRNDTYFSQKVRNLKSHKTLLPYVKYTKDGYCITPEGIEKIEEYKMLSSTNFDDTVKEVAIDEIIDKNRDYVPECDVDEGSESEYKIKARERSSVLRKYAFDYFKSKNQIKCDICGFDFENVYGLMGKDYIEIHHIIPISLYKAKGDKKSLSEAIKNLMPVCSNCHKIIHKTKDFTGEKIKKQLKAKK